MNYQFNSCNKIIFFYLKKYYFTTDEFKFFLKKEFNNNFLNKKKLIDQYLVTLGELVIYQKAKTEAKINTSKSIKFMNNSNYILLWSNLLGITVKTNIIDKRFLGLSLLSEYHKNQAIFYGIKSGIKNFSNKVSIKHPENMGVVIYQVKSFLTI